MFGPQPLNTDLFWPFFYPLSWVWAWVSRFLISTKSKVTVTIPSICVGAIHSGGVGKTPLVAAIAKHFESRHPAILSRGYRGKKEKENAEVKPSEENGVGIYGDEPWMLAQQGFKVFVGADRLNSIQQFEIEKKNGLLILDDGFQSHRIRGAINLVVIPLGKSPREAHCLPMRDLREPVTGLGRATAVIFTGPAGKIGYQAEWTQVLERVCPGLPVFSLNTVVEKPVTLEGPVFGFSGIAAPERFAESLKELGGKQVRTFPDHHAYTAKDVADLVQNFGRSATWVTTEKDHYKVQPYFQALGVSLTCLKMRYEIPVEFWNFLESVLIRKSA